MYRLCITLISLPVVLTMACGNAQRTPASLPQSDVAVHAPVLELYDKQPFRFEANEGQTDPQVKFFSRSSDYTLYLTEQEAVLALPKGGYQSLEMLQTTISPMSSGSEDIQATEYSVVHMKLVDSNPSPEIASLDEMASKSNYYIGSDPEGWHTRIPNYASVRYENVYPGIDLIYYGNSRQLECDFIVAPGADAEQIRLKFEGADQLTLNGEGDVTAHVDGGSVIHPLQFLQDFVWFWWLLFTQTEDIPARCRPSILCA